ncbi:MAG: phosphodiester glycosidase family protein [Candidatus Gastranaerophilales bacterium]|nr:phosphodiester glycosidase family protein [Candidatus Gastranaerophilales bacterium]
MNTFEAESILQQYIQENTMYKEQENNALFLWENSLVEKYGKNKVQKLDDGVVYVSLIKYINSRRIKINVAEINRNINENIEISPLMSVNKKSKINNIATQNNVLVAVNGTYFKQDTGKPLGTLVINDKIISGPIYERVGMGISDVGFKTSRIAFTGELKNETTTIKIDNINQPRMMYSEVLLYNQNWGLKSAETKKDSTHIVILNNKIIAKSDYPLYIPDNGFVLSAPKTTLKGFKLGDKVTINYNLNPNWEDTDHIISGGPYLIKEGSIFVDPISQKLTSIAGKNPRTAIGYTKDNVMIMVTVDGRKEGSTGVTLKELANIMKDLGCYEAINLDGGSSTVMYVNGNVYTGSNLKNSTSISNALAVRVKA